MLLLKITAMLVLAAVLEGFVPRYWPAFRSVDLILILTVYVGLMRDQWLGMGVGFVAGLVSDVAPGMGGIVGVGGFTKTVVGFLVATVGVRFSLEGPLMRVAALALASLFNAVMAVLLYAMLDWPVGGSLTMADHIRVIGFETAANVVFGVFIFYLLDKVFSEKVAEGQMRVRRRFYE